MKLRSSRFKVKSLTAIVNLAEIGNTMKRIVVSGGSKGIGRAIALRFASENFAVALYSRHAADLEKVKEELKEAGAPQVITREVDAARTEEVRSFADSVLAEWEGVDVLVNNVGTFQPENILDAAPGALEKMIQVNLYAGYYLTRYLAGEMPEDGKGYIFNICSTAGLQAYPSGNLYAISKHAMLGFSRGLREELKGRVRVSAVLPGAVWTDSWKGSPLPPSRFMPAEDLAGIIWQAWSASPRTVIDEIILRPLEGDI